MERKERRHRTREFKLEGVRQAAGGGKTEAKVARERQAAGEERAGRQTYGAQRLHAELSVQEFACRRNAVAKLMRSAQRVPKAIRHFRAIVGWAMHQTPGGPLTTDALAMAMSRRDLPELVRSDRGSTCANSISLNLIGRHGIRQRMSRKGHCWENAPMESFFRSLKTALGMHCDHESRDQARAGLFDCTEVFYDRQRRHATINNVAPSALEKSTSA